MNTLRLFAAQNLSIPASTSWYLADLGEFRGKQELYTQQSPQRLKTLREHALIESAVSSNRIEGVSVDPSRVRDVLIPSGRGRHVGAKAVRATTIKKKPVVSDARKIRRKIT